MSLPPFNAVNVLLAASPILLILFLMAVRRWPATRAGPAGWLLAGVVAILAFGGSFDLLWVAAGRGLLLALFVLYIIWMALLFYQVVNEAGVIAAISQDLPRIARNPAEQGLLVAWVFGSFLQGAAGFGVPAAVVAPLLLGLGFAPDVAVVAALIGHGWAVTFGSLGNSFFILVGATGLPGEMLAGSSALLLGLTCYGCGLAVLWLSGGLPALGRQWLRLLVLGSLMAGVQWLLAVNGLWAMAAFGAGLAGLAVAGLDFRFGVLDFSGQGRLAPVPAPGADSRAPALYASAPTPGRSTAVGLPWSRLARAFGPYFLLTGVILAGGLWLKGPLNQVELNYRFPRVVTAYGWETAAGPGRSISLFGHAGALLLYTSLLSHLWFRWRGPMRAGLYRWQPIWRNTLRRSRNSTISIIALVAMAVTMDHAGMTRLLAEAMSAGTGPLYPLISPFIGALGAFMTGSNTNSNVLFATLQQQTALALDLSLPVILAAQTTGGAIGSVFAPAKVIVGCSTVAGARSGPVLKMTTAYSLAIIALVGVVVLLWAMLGT